MLRGRSETSRTDLGGRSDNACGIEEHLWTFGSSELGHARPNSHVLISGGDYLALQEFVDSDNGEK